MRKEWLIEQEEAREDFKNHVAVRKVCDTPLGPMDMLHWHQPGYSNFEIRYVLFPAVGRLFVYGDLGEAVHGFWSGASYEVIAKMGHCRYADKCEASEFGKGGRQWSREYAEHSLQGMIDEAIADSGVECVPVSVKDFIEEYTYEDALANEFEWSRLLCEHGPILAIPEGSVDSDKERLLPAVDFTDRREALGDHVARRIQWHRWGIELALGQLAQKEKTIECLAG